VSTTDSTDYSSLGRSGILTSSHLVFSAAGHKLKPADERCYLCGGPAFDPVPRDEWVKPTFTDFAYAAAPESDAICAACVWALSDRNAELQTMRGKDKPQRMRNYSHIVHAGQWHAYTKGEKRDIVRHLIDGTGLPELCIIAESGQKHLVFKAQTNPPSQCAGWIIFEERSMWIKQDQLRTAYHRIIDLMAAGCFKSEIESGNYSRNHIAKCGLEMWRQTEQFLKSVRGSDEFTVAIFLATKEVADERAALQQSSAATVSSLGPDPGGLQAEIRPQHLGSVPVENQGGSVHERPEQGFQLALFDV